MATARENYVTHADLQAFGVKLANDISKSIVDEVGAMLHDSMNVIGKNFENLQNSFKELKQDVNVLKQDVSVLKQDVSVLKQDMDELKDEVKVLKLDVGELKIGQARIERKLDGQIVAHNRLEKRVTKLEEKIA